MLTVSALTASGFTTVTYDTNAPDGASVVREVAADTDRGLGKGYLLSDDRPEVEGYTFMGWRSSRMPKLPKRWKKSTLQQTLTVYAFGNLLKRRLLR